ncbi:MAG: putative metalloprotease CJM1_0395 family protein [Pseudomonas sp.]|uniref:putative metalloprotease CJM1_0395 family protein n=1 Tax=Pseudomonas sp. TaxID=306 RepID=UPI00273545CD|nr:putative metalloprotease CJM1_0395 family protein [Pseudomonas sp.]MDP3847821.1 putative metalloprotease CJM1_0395 family protein [Pseudomonas sp.]
MNVGGLGHFATAASVALPARASLRSVTAESLLGLASPSPSASSAAVQPESDSSATVDAAGRPVVTPAQEQLIQQQVAQLSRRDREVRAHEQAHASVGGNYAGGPTYIFKRGPDGRTYAVGGEVSIDASAIANDPAATLRKMEQVARAALAPAEPSGQDRRVAAQAQVLAAQARVELAVQQRDAAASAIAERKALAAQDEQDESEQQTEQATKTDQQDADLAPSLQLYRRLGLPQEPASVLNEVA